MFALVGDAIDIGRSIKTDWVLLQIDLEIKKLRPNFFSKRKMPRWKTAAKVEALRALRAIIAGRE
jgi:hypothetical protein